MIWDVHTESKFKILISKIPVFHRRITESVVSRQAENIAESRSCLQVEDQDVIAAFFTDVPSPFYSMMVRLLGQNGFDYKKYGFAKPEGNACLPARQGAASNSRSHKEIKS